MRVSSSSNQEAWLFTLAEEKLSVFANRIDQELPDVAVLVRGNAVANSFIKEGTKKSISGPSYIKLEPKIQLCEIFSNNANQEHLRPPPIASLETFGGFRKKLIETFVPR